MKINVEPISQWAIQNINSFQVNKAGQHRRFKIFDKNYPIEVLEVRKQIITAFNLEGKQQEPLYKDFCGFITEGGFVHKHKDPNKNGLVHTRFNVLVSKPNEGGKVFIDNKEVVVEEGGVWVCKAGLYEHWTTPVIGDKPRIVLSFGFLL